MAGRPSKYRKDFHPQNFIELSKQGKTFAQIALAWHIDRDTIKKWKKRYKSFDAAVKIGREFCEAWYMDLGQRAMLDSVTINGKKVKVNLGFYVWMTKNMFNWRDKVDQKNQTQVQVPNDVQVVVSLPANGSETTD
jgi:hypothetical protein